MIMKRRVTRFLNNYWGYVVIGVALLVWWMADDRARMAPLVLIASVISLFYFLFRVPRSCGAEGRQGPCRNNARGLLFGCNQVRVHKRQNLLRRVGWHKWRELNRGLWMKPRDKLATLSCAGTLLSGFAATFAVLLDRG